MIDKFAPNALPQTYATTKLDQFENAIRLFGVGNFAEYCGHEYRGDFAKDQIEHLETQFKTERK